MSGIQGRLNQQFAITIAVSVDDLGVQRADAVAGAVGDAAAAAQAERAAGSAASSTGSIAGSRRATHGYVSLSHGLIRKPLIGIAILLLFAVGDRAARQRLPTQLPAGRGLRLLPAEHPAAAGRVARAHRRRRRARSTRILAEDRGRRATSTPSSASACSRASRPATTPSTSCSFKPWDERHDAAAAGARDRESAERRSCARRCPKRRRSRSCRRRFPASAARAASRCGCRIAAAARSSSSNAQLQKFLAAARKRPELAGVTSPFTASVPQIYADVDRDKVLRQGVALGDVYQTMQAFLGGLYVNQFNRFGRQWRVFLQAEGEDRTIAGADRPVLRAQRRRRRWCRCRRCRSTQPTFGPQFTNRFNVYRAAQITGTAAPGYSSGQAMAALEDVARQTLPREISYDWSDLSYQERQARARPGRSSRCRWSSSS